MKISRKWKLRKVAIMLTLAVMLMSAFTLTAHASSAKIPYNFLFNGINGTRTVDGVKNDIGGENEDYAGVSIKGAEFGTGSVCFWVNDDDGHSITDKTGQINYLSDGIPMKYNTLNGVSNGTWLTMYCKATFGVQGLGGNFQP